MYTYLIGIVKGYLIIGKVLEPFLLKLYCVFESPLYVDCFFDLKGWMILSAIYINFDY